MNHHMQLIKLQARQTAAASHNILYPCFFASWAWLFLSHSVQDKKKLNPAHFEHIRSFVVTPEGTKDNMAKLQQVLFLTRQTCGIPVLKQVSKLYTSIFFLPLPLTPKMS